MKSTDSPLATAAVWLGIAFVGGIALMIVLSVLLALVGVAIGITAAIVGLLFKLLPYVALGALVWVAYKYYTDDSGSVATEGRRASDRHTAAGGTTSDRKATDGSGDPVETLRRRYVAGEIGEDEFERRMDRLMDSDRQRTGGSDVSSPQRNRERLDE